MDLVSDGTIDAGILHGSLVGNEFQGFHIQNLPGIYSSAEEAYHGTVSVAGDLDRFISEETDGGVIFSHGWYPDLEQYLFCRDAVKSPVDFQGARTRSNSTNQKEWIEGMGGGNEFIAFSDVFIALRDDILDCAFTGAQAGHTRRWHQVVDHLAGPLHNLQAHSYAINSRIWSLVPQDLREIIIEEGAKLELEALRLVPAQLEVGVTRLRDAGMDYTPFSNQMANASRQVAMEHVIPGWVRRMDDKNDPIITDTFNDKLGPIVGMRINPGRHGDRPAVGRAKAHRRSGGAGVAGPAAWLCTA